MNEQEKKDYLKNRIPIEKYVYFNLQYDINRELKKAYKHNHVNGSYVPEFSEHYNLFKKSVEHVCLLHINKFFKDVFEERDDRFIKIYNLETTANNQLRISYECYESEVQYTERINEENKFQSYTKEKMKNDICNFIDDSDPDDVVKIIKYIENITDMRDAYSM
jgi:hypothetical protein